MYKLIILILSILVLTGCGPQAMPDDAVQAPEADQPSEDQTAPEQSPETTHEEDSENLQYEMEEFNDFEEDFDFSDMEGLDAELADFDW